MEIISNNKSRSNFKFIDCFDQGNEYYEQNNEKKAAECFKLAMECEDAERCISSLSVQKRNDMGEVLFNAEEYGLALKCVDNISNNDKAIMCTGDCYYRLGMIDEALGKYKLVDPDELSDFQRKFVAKKICAANPTEALEYYWACDDSDPEVIMGIGNCWLAIGDVDKAIEKYDSLLSANYDRELGRAIADLFFEKGMPEHAVKYYLDSVDCLNDKETAYRVAEGYKASGTLEKAAEYYLVSLDMISVGKKLEEIADLLFECGYTTAAVECYDRILNENPNALSSAKQERVADYYCEKGELDKGVELYKHIYHLKSEVRVAKKTADILWENDMQSLAVEWYEEYIAKTNDGLIAKKLGDYYIKENIEKAVDWYSQYVIWSKDYAFAKDMADELWAKGEHLCAVSLYEIYAKKRPTLTTAQLLGEYYKSIDACEKAIEWYEQCYRLSKKEKEKYIQLIIGLYKRCINKDGAFDWYKQLGDILLSRGEKEAAMQQYAECIEIDFDQSIARLLGEYYLEKDLWNEALPIYIKLYENSARNDENTVRNIVDIYAALLKNSGSKKYSGEDLKRWGKRLGDIALANGDVGKAACEYRKWGIDNLEISTRKRIGDYYLSKGDPDSAREWCAGSLDAETKKSLADLYFDRKEDESALECAIKYYEEYCSFEEWKAEESYHSLCVDMYFDGFWGDGRIKAIESTEDSWDVIRNASDDDYKKYRQRLLKRGAKASDISNSAAYFRYRTFESYFGCGHGHAEKYKDTLVKLAALYNGSKYFKQKYSDTLVKLGDVCRACEDYDGAVAAYLEAGVNITDPDFQEQLAKYYLRKGNPTEADKWFDQCFNGKDSAWAYSIGDLFFNKGYKKKAFDWYEKSWHIKNDSTIALKIGDFFLSERDENKANSWYERGFDGKNHAAALHAGDEFFKAGSADRANEWYIRSWNIKNNGLLAYRIGNYYWQKGPQSKAYEWFEHCLKDTTNIDVVQKMSKYYYSNKNFDAILSLCEEGGEKYAEPFLEDSEFEIVGDYYYDKGSFDSALKIYNMIQNKKQVHIIKIYECYYFSGNHHEAEPFFTTHFHARVVKGDGFAVMSDGTLLIECKKHLIVVDKNMISKIVIKGDNTSNRRSCRLVLNGKAPKELPRKIKLFDNAYKNSPIIGMLNLNFSCQTEIKKVKNKKRIFANILGMMSILLVSFVGLLVSYTYTCNYRYSFTPWILVMFIPLIINLTLSRVACRKSGVSIVLSFLTFVVQNAFHLDIQWELWADKYDWYYYLPWYGIGRTFVFVILAAMFFRTVWVSRKDDSIDKLDILGQLFILAIGCLGIALADIHAYEELTWSFFQWLWISILPFALSMLALKFFCKGNKLFPSIISWGTLIVQCLSNIYLQWFLWLDPNDGEPCILEFLWYGIISTAIYMIICWFIYKVATDDN